MSVAEKNLRAENAALRARLQEAEEMLHAIRSGDVDALVVESAGGPQIFALQGLDAEASRFRGDILAQISEAVIAIDENRRVTFLNAAAERQYGVAASGVLGCCLSELFENRWLGTDHEALATTALRETGRWRGENIHVKRGGEVIHVESSVSLLPGANGVLVVIRDVTERHHAEAALQASEQQLRLIADIAPVLIAHCDREHRYKFVNEPYAARFGLRRGEVLGKRIAEVVGNAAYESIRPHVERVLTGETVEFEIAIPYEKLGTHYMRCAYAPEVDAAGEVIGLVGAILDITERKRAEEVLRENEALFSTIIEQAPGGVYVVDDKFRTLKVNALARPIFAAAEPVIGRDFGEVMRILWGPELGVELTEIFRHTLETGERYVSPRFTEQRADLGISQSYDWETQRLTLPNGRCGVVCYFTETTGQRAHEAALREAKEAAEAANASKDRFLAVLSHELRTPLTPVLMAVAALEHDPALPEQMREDFAMMKRNIQLETKLIDDLLDLSRITTGKLELKIQAVDLNAVVRHVCEICRAQLVEQKVRLETVLAEDAGLVAADTARLQQVLWNVLKNAIKFTPENGTIRVTTARRGRGRREVRVRDSGIGISPEVLPRIFEAFEQGDARITRQFGGLGLGLAISHALVERHGGTIRAESAGSGQGATFILELPGRSAAPAAATLEGSPAAAAGAGAIRLLVVEDHADTARLLERLLGRAGFAVTSASDVASALAAAARETFDVIVSDLGLPDGSGCELLQRLHATRAIPGIAMSGFGMEEDVRRSREAGFSEHLVKPIEVPELIAAIRRVAEHRKGKPTLPG